MNKSVLATWVMTCLAALLFSFSAEPGGDSFTIYQNDRLLLKQYVHADASVKTITLTEGSGSDVLKIYYSHCGKIGLSRKITIEDRDRKVLATWDFENSQGKSHSPMTCPVREIVALKKAHDKEMLSVVYYSREIPEGKTLARVAAGTELSMNR